MFNREKSQSIFDRALNVLVNGVSSNFRYLGKKETPVVKRNGGARIWDAEGNEFIDYRLGWGPIIIEHADVRFNRSVVKYLEQVQPKSTTP